MPDLPVGESDPLAPLLPYLQHDADCELAEPVSDHDKALYYAATGRLAEDPDGWDEECDCGMLAALAEVRASVPTLSDEDRRFVSSVREQSEGYTDGEDWWQTSPTDCVKLCDLIDARFPDLGDQDE